MDLWIPISIGAAFSQNLRFMLQKHLKATGLSTAGATFARFLFAAPLAAALLWVLVRANGWSLPALSPRFFLFAGIGGLAQILATMCVVALFSRRNFAVGITFKKTETIQTALIGVIVLGEGISGYGLLAILIGLVGVILLSDPPERQGRGGWRRYFNGAAGLGLASGALFGVSAIGYRGASLSLGEAHFLLRSVFTLMCVTTFQTVIMAVWLSLREKGEIAKVLHHWRITALVGLSGMIGSLGWFTAFTLQNAAYVKALGQVELIFSFLASALFFKETTTLRELSGIGFVVLSILVLVLFL
ncbi:EamA family transporter [Neptunicoccus cionae]|uniref:Membrane protein n=1 Tax=Neptunicoccus cionae TaxID=2035344 RepID=A0A916QRN6_9RHOB|nr:EamA family transporter [Amylibacter cionae]GGA08599.1 membrane protein [Amylibacter cionae]